MSELFLDEAGRFRGAHCSVADPGADLGGAWGEGAGGRGPHQTLYVDDDTRPPRPVQLKWKNRPRGSSTRS